MAQPNAQQSRISILNKLLLGGTLLALVLVGIVGQYAKASSLDACQSPASANQGFKVLTVIAIVLAITNIATAIKSKQSFHGLLSAIMLGFAIFYIPLMWFLTYFCLSG